MSPTVKLHYFNATGRANQIRLALAVGGIPFEDVFADGFPPSDECRAKWAELTNGNTTFAVPILTTDEGTDKQQVYLQSSAILRAVGRMGGIQMKLDNDPDGDRASYLTDRAIADAEDLRSASYKGWTMFGATQEAADNFAKVALPKHVANIEKQLIASGSDYFGGSSVLSLADIALYDAVVFSGRNLITGIEGIEDPCGPVLTAWIARVESNEKIAAYQKSDQYTTLGMVGDKAVLGY